MRKPVDCTRRIERQINGRWVSSYRPLIGSMRADPYLITGLILHLLSFFTLPYHNEEDMALLEPEIRAYPG